MSNSLVYQDKVYGTVSITEPVILDIIRTPEFARLAGVDQAGYFEVHFPGSRHSRYEHSLGVYELLRRYGAPLAEQVAGLIHDVSHSAFSHTIDYIMHDGSGAYQTYQDEILEDYLKRSQICEVLKQHNVAISHIVNDANFPLKETQLPDICADRLDYSLRAFLYFGIASDQAIRYFLQHLRVEDNRWVFDDVESARGYARLFKDLNDIYYCGPPTAHMFRTTADYLLHALKYGYLEKDDLYTTDAAVLEKIRAYHAHDLLLQKLWLRMNNVTRWEVSPHDYTVRVLCKSRCVDPLCRHEGAVRPLSAVHPEWQDIVRETLLPKEHFLKFYD